MLCLGCVILWWEREALSPWEPLTDLCAVGWVLLDKSEDLASICSCLNSLPGNYPQAHSLSIVKCYCLHNTRHIFSLKPQLLTVTQNLHAEDLSCLSAGRPFVCVCVCVCVKERERWQKKILKDRKHRDSLVKFRPLPTQSRSLYLCMGKKWDRGRISRNSSGRERERGKSEERNINGIGGEVNKRNRCVSLHVLFVYCLKSLWLVCYIILLQF